MCKRAFGPVFDAISRTKRASTLSLPRVTMPNFSCSLTRNITSHSMENLAFHSLKLPDDYTTNFHYITYTFLFWRFGRMYFLNLGVKGLKYPARMLSHEASPGLERKLPNIIWRHYFVAVLRDETPVQGTLKQVLYAKSHQRVFIQSWARSELKPLAATWSTGLRFTRQAQENGRLITSSGNCLSCSNYFLINIGLLGPSNHYCGLEIYIIIWG